LKLAGAIADRKVPDMHKPAGELNPEFAWPMFPSTRAKFPLGTSAESAKCKALATTL
jgi:hypothetical protein